MLKVGRKELSLAALGIAVDNYIIRRGGIVVLISCLKIALLLSLKPDILLLK